MNNKNLILRDTLYANLEEMLALVIKNAPLSNVMAHTRSDKSRVLLYNPVIVFSLIITL